MIAKLLLGFGGDRSCNWPSDVDRKNVEYLVEETNNFATQQDLKHLEQRLADKIQISILKLNLGLAIVLIGFMFAMFKLFSPN